MSTSIRMCLVAIFFSNTAFHSLHCAAECKFPALFNFGDSNSDTGGLSAAFGPAPQPNGETFFGKPVGRYCDGRLIIDFIAKSLGLPYLSAYLDALGTNFQHGANFATAGSTVLRQNTSLFQSGFSPISLEVQLWQFSQFKIRSGPVRQLGGAYSTFVPKDEDFPRALYTFDIGQNDLTSAYFSNMTTEDVEATIPSVCALHSTIIKNIYDQGGRYFWVHNTGPFGCLAYVLVRLQNIKTNKDNAGCGIIFNKVAQHFNQQLKDEVFKLRKELPDASITYVDVYSVKYDLIVHAGKHGFKDPLKACCGHGGRYNYNREVGCGGSVKINNTMVLVGKSCTNPSSRVNWDGVHYTEAANHFIFEKIASGAYSDPPLSLHEACQKTH